MSCEDTPPIHDPACFCQVQTAYNIIVWLCLTINVCVLIVNLRMMVCRWMDVKEEQTRQAIKAALISEREGRKELQRAEQLIRREWDAV